MPGKAGKTRGKRIDQYHHLQIECLVWLGMKEGRLRGFKCASKSVPQHPVVTKDRALLFKEEVFAADYRWTKGKRIVL